MGAPRGNTNALGSDQTAPKPFLDAINRAIKQTDGKKLRAAAEKLLDLAANGEPWAIKELADRTDGKAAQGVSLSTPDGPLMLTVAERPRLSREEWLKTLDNPAALILKEKE